MSEENEPVEGPSQLTLLQNRCKLMGIKFHHKAGVETLQSLIAEKQGPVQKEVEVTPGVETPGQRRARLHKEAGRMVRIRMNCMDPNKKDWEGEIFTVSNAVVGTFKKYVPFNNDAGWYVPHIIFEHLKAKQCQIFYNEKNDRGMKIRKGKLINAFAVELMPDLTTSEMRDLATKQAMSGTIGT